MNNEVRIAFNEGRRENYYNAFHTALGGDVGSHSYVVNKGPAKVWIESFDVIEDMDISLMGLHTNKAIVLDRQADNDPDYLHIFISKEGVYGQSYDGKTQNMGSSTINGVFVYNGLFPTLIRFEPGPDYKIVAIKINIASAKDVLNDGNLILKSLFNDIREGLVYHLPLSREFERLVEDIFEFNALKVGRKTMVISRALEVFVNLTQSLKVLDENNELFGLHVDDYERIQKLKLRLTTVFDEKFTVDELAVEYGVSPSKLKRDFKQIYNSSIYQFYNHARMDEAYRRLKSGAFSVSEIGYDLGYSNASKFTEMFKKIKGILPTEVVAMKK